jgi:endoglucanase
MQINKYMRQAPKNKQKKLLFHKKILILLAALVTFLVGSMTKLPTYNQLDVASAAITMQLPLSP